MKAVMLANAVIMSAYAVCVTYAAVYFDNPKTLWWYVMLGFLGFSFKSGGADNERKAD